MGEPEAGPDALELQAHAISTALEEKHGVMIEDFWRRGGRAFLKYWPPGGPMWTGIQGRVPTTSTSQYVENSFRASRARGLEL